MPPPVALYLGRGSAQAGARAGVKAVATGSLSLASALGFEDGKAITFDVLFQQIRRMAAATDLPFSAGIAIGHPSNLT